MKNALIVGGGPVDKRLLEDELAKKPDLLIAVDRGGFYLYESGVTPRVLIGDFDSLSANIMDKLVYAGAELLPFSPRKDETDMELALDYAISQGFRSAVILGGLGRRFDHSLSNIGLLVKGLQQGIEIFLLDETHEITAIDHRLTLKRRPGWAVSLIPITEKVGGVTTSGLVFPLNQADLFIQKSRGIHNEFAEELATVEITQGLLLVILFKEEES